MSGFGKILYTMLIRCVLFCVIFWSGISIASVQAFEQVPEKLQAALFVKVLGMSKEISNGEDISIHVVRSPGTAAELRKAIGRKIGKSKLVAVNEGDEMPVYQPDAIYIGDAEQLEEVIRYCRQNDVLSMTGIPELVENGVTLGVGMQGSKPRILLNVPASKAEQITWNPAIIKISKHYH